MTEIEPTIDNVQPGDVVTIEKGTPGESGHHLKTGKWSVIFLRHCTDDGWRITRITRPAPPIPDKPGVRFWARWRSTDPREYIVTDRGRIVDLSHGDTWNRDLFERRHAIVPAPEPETVPVPADLIREAEEWVDGCAAISTEAGRRLETIVQAVRKREEEDDE